jgi:hypothetical protein
MESKIKKYFLDSLEAKEKIGFCLTKQSCFTGEIDQPLFLISEGPC